jgi:hypothetical protein
MRNFRARSAELVIRMQEPGRLLVGIVSYSEGSPRLLLRSISFEMPLNPSVRVVYKNNEQDHWHFTVRLQIPHCRRAQALAAGSRPDRPSTAMRRSSVNRQISKTPIAASEHPRARKFKFDRDSQCRRIATTAASGASII